MNPPALYEVRIAGPTPVFVVTDQPIGQEPTRRVHVGALVLVISPELADDLADALIESAAEESAPVFLT